MKQQYSIIRMHVGGLKCDHPGCDYHDDNVEFADYPQWLNKACPKCGSNLLTQADMDKTLEIFAAANALNAWVNKWIPGWILRFFALEKGICPNSTLSVEMKGDGSVSMKEIR